jgi:hypothetical protein
MSDETTPDFTEEPLDEPGLVMDRKVLLLALGGMVVGAVLLGLLRARLAAPRPSASLGQDVVLDEGWQSSLQHLAHNFDMRLQGIDARLEMLAEDKVVATAAAFSAPPVNLDQQNGSVERIPPTMEAGATEPAPPQPAAVSLPPE